MRILTQSQKFRPTVGLSHKICRNNDEAEFREWQTNNWLLSSPEAHVIREIPSLTLLMIFCSTFRQELSITIMWDKLHSEANGNTCRDPFKKKLGDAKESLWKKGKKYWQISNHSRKWQTASAVLVPTGRSGNPLTSCSNSVLFRRDGREEGKSKLLNQSP